jgi:hypothetical protein
VKILWHPFGICCSQQAPAAGGAVWLWGGGAFRHIGECCIASLSDNMVVIVELESGVVAQQQANLVVNFVAVVSKTFST